MNITYDESSGRFVLPQVTRVVVEIDGEPFAEFEIPSTPFTIEFTRLPRDAAARTLVVYTYCGDERVGESRPATARYPETWSVQIEPTTIADPEPFDGRALMEAWFAAERDRTCPDDCADCADMEANEP